MKVNDGPGIFDRLVGLESRSARLSATLDAHPEIGRIWRLATGLQESSCTLSLEDIPVNDNDILASMLDLDIPDCDPQSLSISKAIQSVLMRPSDLALEPGAGLDRCFLSSRMTELHSGPDGREVLGYSMDMTGPLYLGLRDLFERHVPGLIRSGSSPFLTALGVVRMVRSYIGEAHPVAERLLLQMAEHTARKQTIVTDRFLGASLPHAGNAPCYWTFLPATSLARGGFRAWSPLHAPGIELLIDRMSATLQREGGRIGAIKTWIERIGHENSAARGRSRLPGLCAIMLRQPFLAARDVTSTLGVTDRTARNLLDQATESRLLSQVTQRRSYRVWAAPFFAEMLLNRPGPALRRPPVGGLRQSPGQGGDHELPLAASSVAERTRRALADLDAALDFADEISRKWVRPI